MPSTKKKTDLSTVPLQPPAMEPNPSPPLLLEGGQDPEILDLTQDQRDLMLQSIRLGNTVKVAAQYAGVDYKYITELVSDGFESAVFERRAFYMQIQQALAEAEIRDVTVIRFAAQTDWRAAAWLLERRNPESWSVKSKMQMEYNHSGTVEHVVDGTVDVEVEVHHDHQVHHIVERPPIEQLAQVLDIMERIGALPATSTRGGRVPLLIDGREDEQIHSSHAPSKAASLSLESDESAP